MFFIVGPESFGVFESLDNCFEGGTKLDFFSQKFGNVDEKARNGEKK